MKILSIVLASCFALATAACDRLTDAEEAALEAKVAPDVRQRASAISFAPVIVRLNTPPGLEFMSSGARAAAMDRLTKEMLTDVSQEEVRIVHRYSIVPIMSAWANDKGLTALAMRDEVNRIVLDRVEQTLLNGSTRTIQAHLAWPTSTGSGRHVAILDTGTDRSHPFVQSRVTHEACFRKDGKCRNLGYQQIGQDAAKSITKPHGMHVAGIAAGANGPLTGGVPLNGVAPGANIIAINIFSTEGAYVGDQVKALEYVAMLKQQQNVNVVAANLSLGDKVKHVNACDAAEPERKTVIDKLLQLGVATVVAAGNDQFSNAVSAPGCISSAVTVSSVSDMDGIIGAHNRSRQTDFMAPGMNIRSSLPKPVYGGAGDYGDQSGTSMAAPHVSGAIALLSAAAPGKTLAQILAALTVTAKPITETVSGTPITYRRIDVNKALIHLKSN